MDSKKSITPEETDLYAADELASQVFRCSYHTFMTEIKVLPDFPVPIGHPGRKGKLHWVREEVIGWRNEHYRIQSGSSPCFTCTQANRQPKGNY